MIRTRASTAAANQQINGELTMSYDSRCYDLAMDFLEDEQLTPPDRATQAHHLAMAIQNAIENFIEELRINGEKQ